MKAPSLLHLYDFSTAWCSPFLPLAGSTADSIGASSVPLQVPELMHGAPPCPLEGSGAGTHLWFETS